MEKSYTPFKSYTGPITIATTEWWLWCIQIMFKSILVKGVFQGCDHPLPLAEWFKSAWFVLCACSVISVALTIFRTRHTVKAGSPQQLTHVPSVWCLTYPIKRDTRYKVLPSLKSPCHRTRPSRGHIILAEPFSTPWSAASWFTNLCHACPSTSLAAFTRYGLYQLCHVSSNG